MRKIALIVMCIGLCAANVIVCDAALAGPLQNAEEFQQKIVEKEEERSSNLELGDESGEIKWQDNDDSDSADPADSTDQDAGKEQGEQY